MFRWEAPAPTQSSSPGERDLECLSDVFCAYLRPVQVLNGQLWSVFMKEWVGVPKKAMSINILSISLLVTAVTIIAIAGAVL